MTGMRSTPLTSILCLVLATAVRPGGAQEPAAPAPADSAATTVLEDLVVTAEGGAGTEVQTGFLDVDAATLAAVPGIVEADPLRALQVLPGVQAASDISSGLYIRGGGPDQTLVLMDGVTIYNPTHAFGFFSTFNNDAVDRVDLFKGAYPACYGGRLGAVVDVRMRQESAPRTSVTGGVSLISARALVEGRGGAPPGGGGGPRGGRGPPRGGGGGPGPTSGWSAPGGAISNPCWMRCGLPRTPSPATPSTT